MRAPPHARDGQRPQEWGRPYCKYDGSLKQNDTPALKQVIFCASLIQNIYFWWTPDLRTLTMLCSDTYIYTYILWHWIQA